MGLLHFDLAAEPNSFEEQIAVPQVYNVKHHHPEDAVLVDRTTPFGNPYTLFTPGVTREMVVEQYNQWIHRPEQGALRGLIRRTLKGKHLLCYCHPKPCHADIILRIANEEIE